MTEHRRHVAGLATATGRGVVAVLGCVVLAGCGALVGGIGRGVPDAPSNPDRVGPAVLIGAGSTQAGAWRAWIYRTKDGSFCLEMASPNAGSSICGGDESALTAPGVSTSPTGTFVTGGTRQPAAVAAIVHLDDGSSTRAATVLPAAGVSTGVRYYVASAPPSALPLTIDIVDAAGRLLETTDVQSGVVTTPKPGE